jgi:hypothetical protein
VFLVAMNYLWLRERVDRYLLSGMLGIEGTAMRFPSTNGYSFVIADNDSILREVGEKTFLQMRCFQLIFQAMR